MIKKAALSVATIVTLGGFDGSCGVSHHDSSDETQRKQQEQILQEGNAQAGMPNIRNFREKKLMKELYELRDQAHLVTYTYLFPENSGKPVFFCVSEGYGMPYATQYTNPQKVEWEGRGDSGISLVTLPQADPNGLFSPPAAEGTWVMCNDPADGRVRPVYLEPKVIVSPFKLTE